MPARKSWRLFCSHGAVLFYIAQHPACTISEIASALVVTPRTVWRLVGDLKRSGLIQTRKDGRRHHYWLEPEGRLPDPVLSHLNLRQIMSVLAPREVGLP